MFGFKRMAIRNIERKIHELSDDLIFYEGKELDEKIKQIRKLQKSLDDFKQPRVSKEVWVEIIRVVGAMATLGTVIYYDSHDGVVRKTFDRWIPTTRL